MNDKLRIYFEKKSTTEHKKCNTHTQEKQNLYKYIYLIVYFVLIENKFKNKTKNIK